ncbi:structural polyprotein [Escherichia phage vB_EcoS Sa179lw]|uniref:Structural polyprotein n=1 Tax=Escherichia phage vB_EcoS Sa179lw TaxID=2126819 RepID=A0A2P1MXA4_9CAUD|nr:structural polyprotein [Escherichia phage vB_EcoS Sa179lw]AVP40205.1 structural polyprotein [Escherichia phage vB_EcoS Sa179lw]
MPAKLRGVRQAVERTSQIVDEIIATKAVRAMKSATYIIRTESATLTPIDTSTLINSQFDTVEVNGTRITGRVGYSAKYAIYVHNASGKLAGKPRSNGNGTYWSPGGEPQFLTKGARRTKDLVDSAIKKEMTL